MVVARSDAMDGVVELPADGTTEPASVEPRWGRSVAAVLRGLAERGRAPIGFDADVSSTVPVGSGLSSSAAFTVAFTIAAARTGGLALDGRALALAAQSAEQRATGLPCGVMDQMASVFGRAGHALLLDCRSLDIEAVPLPESVAVVVVHTGVARRLEDSAYAERRAACEAAAAHARSGNAARRHRSSRSRAIRSRATSCRRTNGCSRSSTRCAPAISIAAAGSWTRATRRCATTSGSRRPSSTRSSTRSWTRGVRRAPDRRGIRRMRGGHGRGRRRRRRRRAHGRALPFRHRASCRRRSWYGPSTAPRSRTDSIR